MDNSFRVCRAKATCHLQSMVNGALSKGDVSFELLM